MPKPEDARRQGWKMDRAAPSTWSFVIARFNRSGACDCLQKWTFWQSWKVKHREIMERSYLLLRILCGSLSQEAEITISCRTSIFEIPN
jgi:hypothetical protein